MKYVVTYELAEGAQALAMEHYPAHRARLDRFHERGELLLVGTFTGFAGHSVEAANCDRGGGCDCCTTYDCEGNHIAVCPTATHNCSHHVGTLCNGGDHGLIEG